MPPATNTGTSVRCGRISCASTPVDHRSDMAAGLAAFDDDRVGAHAHQLARQTKRRSKADDSGAALLDPARSPARSEARPPARRDRPDGRRTPRSAPSSCGCSVIRLTPNGRSVSARVAAISAASSSGDIDPEAMTPNPPAFEIAATRLRSDTQVIAPPMIARSVPRNARPRAHSRSSSPAAVVGSDTWSARRAPPFRREIR